MKLMFAVCVLPVLMFSTSSVNAQYVGPGGEATTVRQMTGFFGDDHLVVLKGSITRRVTGDLYEFDDGTGKVYLDMDHNKHWPGWPAEKVDENTHLEVYGKYIHKHLSFSKVKVIDMRVVK